MVCNNQTNATKHYETATSKSARARPREPHIRSDAAELTVVDEPPLPVCRARGIEEELVVNLQDVVARAFVSLCLSEGIAAVSGYTHVLTGYFLCEEALDSVRDRGRSHRGAYRHHV